jgi:hypothetical protein
LLSLGIRQLLNFRLPQLAIAPLPRAIETAENAEATYAEYRRQKRAGQGGAESDYLFDSRWQRTSPANSTSPLAHSCSRILARRWSIPDGLGVKRSSNMNSAAAEFARVVQLGEWPMDVRFQIKCDWPRFFPNLVRLRVPHYLRLQVEEPVQSTTTKRRFHQRMILPGANSTDSSLLMFHLFKR